jgi:hypothetical protein
MSRRPSERFAPPLPPPSSETLRRAALVRSQQRGQRVARRRLAWRWTLWGLGQALKWLVPMAAGVAALGWLASMLWLSAPPSDTVAQTPAAAPASAMAASANTPAPTSATPSATPPATPPATTLPPPSRPALPLRLDDGEPAAAGDGAAASRAQSVSSSPPAADRSSP